MTQGTGNNPPNTGAGRQAATKQREHGLGFVPPSRLLKVIYWLCVVVLLVFCWFNIRPYALAIKHVFTDQIHLGLPAIITTPLYATPIGALFRIAFSNFNWLLGAALWAIIQSIEILPIVIEKNKAFLRTVIQESGNIQTFEISPNDDPALAALKRLFNKLPAEILKDARNFAYFIYVVDFCVVFSVYPPCSGGFTRLGLILATGQWSKLDYSNLVAMAVTLFGVEILVRLIFWVGQFAYYMRKTYSN